MKERDFRFKPREDYLFLRNVAADSGFYPFGFAYQSREVLWALFVGIYGFWRCCVFSERYIPTNHATNTAT